MVKVAQLRIRLNYCSRPLQRSFTASALALTVDIRTYFMVRCNRHGLGAQ